MLLLAFASCRKDSTTTTNNTSHNDTITKVKNCHWTESVSYNQSGSPTSTSDAYYSGNRLDSVVSVNPSGRNLTVYVYSSQSEAWVSNYVNGVLQTGQKTRILYDGNFNAIRYESYDNSNNLQGYSTTSYNCN